ncbi:hypothetical protein FH972_023514 [Carpinus fangiana]|uniref:AB hydrolase-1 domain-containing protein n=1 Tax=Carpinus fangiana TaxID=176857 RepID=A0A5N6KVW0_9ROSI|nr:hypothetical protein FH972_023514 [Carpinus fangiana]
MTRLTTLLSLLFAWGAFAAPIDSESKAPSFIFAGDAPYGVDSDVLDSVMTCAQEITPNSKNAVLLIHGTGSTGSESWARSYAKSLPTAGYAACYIDLPDRALADAQVSAAYIAYNMHKLSRMAGGNAIAVMSHSQGGPDTQWALRFWPSTHGVVRAFVGLSPDLTGVTRNSTISIACYTTQAAPLVCEPSLWQQAVGSNFTTVLKNDAAALVPTTLLWSETDTTVIPPEENASLPGATSYSVQKLCPEAVTDHVGMLFAAPTFAYAVDALDHGGRASFDRVKPDADKLCYTLYAPGLNDADVAYLEGSVGAVGGIA